MTHTLADELQPWLCDGIRVFYLVDKIARALDGVHPALQPANVIIDGEDVRLVETAPPLAPFVAPDAELTERSNVYSLAMMLHALLAERPKIAPECLSLIAQSTSTKPKQRPTLDQFRSQLGALGWNVFVHGPWHRAFVPREAHERALVTALRANPMDNATRHVYADWLEQHGFESRARFLRNEEASDADVGWRAVLSWAFVACSTKGCAKTWAKMQQTSFDNVRTCAQCTKQVRYCGSLVEVKNEASRDVELALDATLSRLDALRTLHMVRTPSYEPMPSNPPPPGGFRANPPRDGNVFQRLFGLFRRR